MHLLDTVTLSEWYRGNLNLLQRLRQHAPSEVGTTIISRIEVMRGRFDLVLKAATAAEVLRAQQLLEQTETFLDSLLVVPLDETAVADFERLKATKGLKKIGRADPLIASIALAPQATLVTRNLRHFQVIPGLQVANWVG